jgi:hypothetical protein
MAAGWVHAALDLIALGRSYFDEHRRKDRFARTVGRWHRRYEHDWYWKFGHNWTLDEPFPREIAEQVEKLSPFEGERLQSNFSHDYLDRVWDDLDDEERCYWEGFFAWLIDNPRLLMTWAGVDVLGGRIARTGYGRTHWHSCPAVRGEYTRLKKYVDSLKRKNPKLREVVIRGGLHSPQVLNTNSATEKRGGDLVPSPPLSLD